LSNSIVEHYGLKFLLEGLSSPVNKI